MGVTTGAEPVTLTILALPILVNADSLELGLGQITPTLVRRMVSTYVRVTIKNLHMHLITTRGKREQKWKK
jgi:hypothetical protein